MKRIYMLVIILAFLTVFGCENKGKQDEAAVAIQGLPAKATCAVCGHKMNEDTYCVSCNAIATTETDLVHCEECDKDFKPGTYCAQCNRFMLNAKVKCGNCLYQVVKGHYCPYEKQFKGLPNIAYCEKHKKPYSRGLSCPDCKDENTKT